MVMRPGFRLYLAMNFVLMLGAIAQAAEIMPVYYDERPPYFITKTTGQPQGILVSVTQEIFEKAGIDFVWYRMPTKRILETMNAPDARGCSPGWYQSADRLKTYKFTKAIYMGHPQIAVLGPGVEMPAPPAAANLMAGPAILIKKDGLRFSDAIEQLISRRDQKKVHSVTFSAADLPRVVAEGQNFFTILPSEQLPGILDTRLRIVVLSDIPETAERFIMCSTAVGDDVIKRLDTAIANLERQKPSADH